MLLLLLLLMFLLTMMEMVTVMMVMVKSDKGEGKEKTFCWFSDVNNIAMHMSCDAWLHFLTI